MNNCLALKWPLYNKILVQQNAVQIFKWNSQLIKAQILNSYIKKDA